MTNQIRRTWAGTLRASGRIPPLDLGAGCHATVGQVNSPSTPLHRAARAPGGYGERVTESGEIVPAIRGGIKATRGGQSVLLEFITQQEIDFSIFK